jgi:translation elongation factor EF-Tu-like GTPase
MSVFAFQDQLEPGPPIKVLARISVLRSQDGGRSAPFAGPYRPNHNFGSPDGRVFYIGQVEVPVGTLIYPGETHDLAITFLNGRGLSELLQVGRRWRIQEGPRLVATAEVLAVLAAA